MTTDFSAKPEFHRFATSFSGIDGGNPSSSVWICGIEQGGSIFDPKFLFSEVSEPPDIKPRESTFLDYQYNRKAAKLLASMAGGTPSEYKKFFKDRKLFHRDGLGFKMNLYPLPFKGSGHECWERHHTEMTGLRTKGWYEVWCQIHRFERIRKWIEEWMPQVIICTGASDKPEFSLAFSRDDEEHFASWQNERIAGKDLCWKLVNDNKSLLFVTPFLGMGGLMSNASLGAFGSKISEISSGHFGERSVLT